jgi:hypothetical protein
MVYTKKKKKKTHANVSVSEGGHFHGFTEAKVAELDEAKVVKEHVLWLDISM